MTDKTHTQIKVSIDIHKKLVAAKNKHESFNGLFERLLKTKAGLTEERHTEIHNETGW